MSKLIQYEDIENVREMMQNTPMDSTTKSNVLFMMNELAALRNTHEVSGAKSELSCVNQFAMQDGVPVYRTGIYDPKEVNPEDVQKAIVMGNVVADDFLIVDKDSVAGKFFNGEYTAKKSPKKSAPTEPTTTY